jgi:hypothetical protein
MDIVTIAVIVLIVLALGGWGYGYYATPVGPAAAGPSPLIHLLGALALLLIVALVVMLATGWRFGISVAHP